MSREVNIMRATSAKPGNCYEYTFESGKTIKLKCVGTLQWLDENCQPKNGTPQSIMGEELAQDPIQIECWSCP